MYTLAGAVGSRLVAPVLQSACSLAATSVRQKLLPYSTEAEATTQWSDPGPFAKMERGHPRGGLTHHRAHRSLHDAGGRGNEGAALN